MKTDTIFVTGTDTGIGKTVLSLILIQHYYKKEMTPFYIKPFQTGCRDPYDTDSDANFIYNHIPQLKDKDPAESVIFCHTNPKAPFFAARDDNDTVSLEAVETKMAKLKQSYNPLIIEGAGGLMVPITANILMIDLIEKLQARIIIAARTGLGTINHTLLTIDTLKRRGLSPSGIVLIDSPTEPATKEMIKENIEAIEMFSHVNVAGVIGNIENFSNIDSKYDHIVERCL
ncbi:MAG: dethiobiotin synthase [Desulfobacterales bacterium]|nr:dethiobiotin synthase [Desulfobacterales bacterium]